MNDTNIVSSVTRSNYTKLASEAIATATNNISNIGYGLIGYHGDTDIILQEIQDADQATLDAGYIVAAGLRKLLGDKKRAVIFLNQLLTAPGAVNIDNKKHRSERLKLVQEQHNYVLRMLALQRDPIKWSSIAQYFKKPINAVVSAALISIGTLIGLGISSCKQPNSPPADMHQAAIKPDTTSTLASGGN